MLTPEELRRLRADGWRLTVPQARHECVECGVTYVAPHPLLCADCYGELPVEHCPCPHAPARLCVGCEACETEGPCRSCRQLTRRERREAERAVKRAQRGRRPGA